MVSVQEAMKEKLLQSLGWLSLEIRRKEDFSLRWRVHTAPSYCKQVNVCIQFVLSADGEPSLALGHYVLSAPQKIPTFPFITCNCLHCYHWQPP